MEYLRIFRNATRYNNSFAKRRKERESEKGKREKGRESGIIMDRRMDKRGWKAVKDEIAKNPKREGNKEDI